MLNKLLPALFLSFFFLTSAQAQTLNPTFQVPYTLMGVTDSVRALGNYGAGITFGVVDTGIQAQWSGFSGKVVSASSGCVISGCATNAALNDDNGHGTFVASEIMGKAGTYSGIATSGKLIAIKALNASGSGLVSDVATAITQAVNRGAQIINLSVSFVPTSDLINAINAAATKGVLIVFAGGNDGKIFQNNTKLTGFTDKALQSLLFAGSTNSGMNVSYYSNKPGDVGFVSTSGKYYSYASHWVMADGEGVYGASTYGDSTGYNYLTTMSGTSMAAPQVAGVAGLIAARWPFLLTNNMLSSVMMQTTKDLGTGGIDNIYGGGFLQAAAAFNPIGTLTVPVNGTNIPVSQAQLMVNGTLTGKAVAAALSKGAAYDAYGRDFKINLSSGISNTAAASTVTTSVYAIGSGSASNRSFTENEDGSWVSSSFTNRGASAAQNDDHMARSGFLHDPNSVANNEWSAGFYSNGTYMGGGAGSGAGYSFNDARWGEKTAFFDSDLSGAGQLLSLAEGNSYAAAGFELNAHERISFGVIMGRNDEKSQLLGNEISSQGFTVGYTWKPDASWGLSFTSAFLKEKNALLGSASGGYLQLGEDARSLSLGMSGNLKLAKDLQIGFDAAVASTDPTDNHSSLIEHTSRLTSAGFGVTMRKENLTGVGDTLTATIKAPMHVFGGKANVNVPIGTDDAGNPTFERVQATLAPDGLETDFTLGYTRPVAEKTVASAAFELRNDADNIQGQVDHAVMFRLTKEF